MATRHFLLTNDDHVEEFTDQQAAEVASGTGALPRFAESRVRYVRVTFDDHANEDGELKVYTMGAIVGFDAEGKVADTDTEEKVRESLTEFEQDACVEFALRDSGANQHALN